jgi:hypothetical protein
MFACSCGMTLKYYHSVDDDLLPWDCISIRDIVNSHKKAGHEQVQNAEARDIRASIKKGRLFIAK